MIPFKSTHHRLTYQALIMASSPFAYYPMTESTPGGSEITVYDIAGRGLNMLGGRNLTKPTTLCNGGGLMLDVASATVPLATLKQNAIYLLGANDRGETDLYNMLMAGVTDGMSIEFWLDNIGGKSGNSECNIFNLGQFIINIISYDANTNFRFMMRSTAADWVQKSGIINASGWNHIVLTYKASSGAGIDANCYINGATSSPLTFDNIDDLRTDSWSRSVVLLGGTGFDNNSEKISQGSIAHTAFYNRKLTQDEVTNHYNLGKSG